MIFRLTYTGPKQWNVTEYYVVRARDEDEARLEVGAEDRGQWACEAFDHDGPPEILASVWKGDPG